jgi:hypothetical protein
VVEEVGAVAELHDEVQELALRVELRAAPRDDVSTSSLL